MGGGGNKAFSAFNLIEVEAELGKRGFKNSQIEIGAFLRKTPPPLPIENIVLNYPIHFSDTLRTMFLGLVALLTRK